MELYLRSLGIPRYSKLKSFRDEVDSSVASSRADGAETVRHFDKPKKLFDIIEVNAKFLSGFRDLSLKLKNIFELLALLLIERGLRIVEKLTRPIQKIMNQWSTGVPRKSGTQNVHVVISSLCRHTGKETRAAYPTSSLHPSSVFFTYAMNWSATAPSIRRWS